MGISNYIYDTVTDLITSCLGLVSPRSAIAYKTTRNLLKRAYDAGKNGGAYASWRPTLKSADGDIAAASRLLLPRARELSQNDPFIAGAIRKVQAAVIADGRYPQARTEFDAFNQAVEMLFERWAEDCDITGQLDFAGLQSLILAALLRDGECFINLIIEKPVKGAKIPPFKLQVFEIDQVVSDKTGTLENGNICKRGIETDKYGKPVAYYFYETNPNDLISGSAKEIRIEAEKIIHCFDKQRASQTRGVSWLAPIINTMRALGEYQEYELVGAQLASSMGIFIKSPYPETSDSAVIDQAGAPVTNQNGNPLDYIEPGMIKRLEPGDSIEIASHNRPNTAYPEFIRSHLRAVSAGLNIGYASFANDYSSESYSSSRSALLQEKSFYKHLHKLMERIFYVPIYNKFLDLAIAGGLLKAPGYAADKYKYQRTEFQQSAIQWVDPYKEAQALKAELELNLNTLQNAASERGRDIKDIIKQRVVENKLLEEAGLTRVNEKPVDPLTQITEALTNAQ